MAAQRVRQPHAVLDLRSRRLKAMKIERLLDIHSHDRPIELLEIGTGSGGIAHYFGTHPTVPFKVTAVDVIDQRLLSHGYRFLKVEGTGLPFEANRFDVVLSNHVIEHVGPLSAQRHHLSEMHRVMRPGGMGYLAVPNRWQIKEPHYRVAFLSWLPRRLRTPYLKLTQRGHHYDCEPLTVGVLESLLADVGYTYRNMGTRALREMLAVEGTGPWLAKLGAKMPNAILDRLGPIIPTLVYQLRK